MDLLGGLRLTMEGERELLLCFGRAKVRKKRQRAIREEGEGYKYPQPPTVTSVMAVPRLKCGSASLQVRQCRTTQDSKSKSEV